MKKKIKKNGIATLLGTPKKSAKKTMSKASKYAAVLTLRIPKTDIKPYDTLLELYRVKSYTDAIGRAVIEVQRQTTELADMNKQIDELQTELQEANEFKERFTELLQMAGEKKGAKKKPAVKKCPDCKKPLDEYGDCEDFENCGYMS